MMKKRYLCRHHLSLCLAFRRFAKKEWEEPNRSVLELSFTAIKCPGTPSKEPGKITTSSGIYATNFKCD